MTKRESLEPGPSETLPMPMTAFLCCYNEEVAVVSLILQCQDNRSRPASANGLTSGSTAKSLDVKRSGQIWWAERWGSSVW